MPSISQQLSALSVPCIVYCTVYTIMQKTATVHLRATAKFLFSFIFPTVFCMAVQPKQYTVYTTTQKTVENVKENGNLRNLNGF